jgi:hypothetical protein
MKEPDLVKAFLGMLGAVMALFGWRAVLSPDIPMTWKGRNAAPLSMPSRTAMAVAFTSWSLILTGFYPLVWATFFAASVAFGLGQSSRDRAAHDTGHGSTTREQGYNILYVWRGLCALAGLVLAVSVYVFARDLRHPPATDEQRFLHVMIIGYLVAATIGAFCLYAKRPGKEQI